MRCDTCKKESAVVMRLVVAKGYNRAMARPLYNCPACFEHKESAKPYKKAAADSQSRESTRPAQEKP